MTFRSKTIIGIATIEVILLVILVVSAMGFLRDSNESQLIQRANTTTEMFMNATKDAVLSTDVARLDDLVNDIVTVEDVQYVKVVRQGITLASAGDNILLKRDVISDVDLSSVNDGVFDKRVPIMVNGDEFGHIEMGFGTESINAMLEKARKSIIGIAAVEVILVAIFSFVLGTYLTRSLVRLTHATKTLSERGPGYQINSASKDELGQLSHAFDEMSRKLEATYDELRQARKEAEYACDSKSRFLASMSHEIRTPMNGVLGILSLLEETKISKEQKQLLTTATESGNFLLSIINDILDFTRMESNTLLLENKKFNVRRSFESVVDTYTTTAKSKDLILHLYFEGSMPEYAKGDVNRLKQVMHNLIGNAMKFTEQGSVTIKVSSELKSDHCLLNFSVIDTGIGIEQDAIPYLFDEFTMVDQTFSRSQEGSGLGLAICQRLCELMDGSISVTSEKGTGSTFSVSVRLDLADDASDETNQSKSSTDDLSHLRILVAEDNKANQLVIVNMFKNVGVNIDVAENGKEALEAVTRYDYDLVFMDISMPVMDGMEACKAIRELDSETANVPIIALTAHALTGDREQFIASGMDDYLSKPVRLSQLVEKIHLFLNINGDEDCNLTQNSQVTLRKSQSEQEETNTEQSEPFPMNHDTSHLDSNLVDETVLQQMIQDTCAEVIPTLIEHYVEESRARLEKIYQAITERDAEQLEFESHTLGSSAMALGNRELALLARKIEGLCLEGQAEEAYQFIDELKDLATRSIAALEARKLKGFEQSA
ncbi:response regulator [Vibrio mexicanus]|uniref:HAMP domain-containing hybrid sensor histidine kinase/response regulator n=1 Tax=Vibrio mexicanus TaxID=1004326 RepID=UPI00063C220F|nr:response regulator [Vibrio mexicanus]